MSDLVLFPVAGWRTMTGPDQLAIVEIDYLVSPMQQLEAAQSIRLAMTPEQCSEAAEALHALAKQAQRRTDSLPGSHH